MSLAMFLGKLPWLRYLPYLAGAAVVSGAV